MARGVQVLAELNGRHRHASREERSRLFWAGMNVPEDARRSDVIRGVDEAHWRLCRQARLAKARVRRAGGVRLARRAVCRPHRSARQPRSVRRTHSTRSGCSPGRPGRPGDDEGAPSELVRLAPVGGAR
jgi:hypothetical protein